MSLALRGGRVVFPLALVFSGFAAWSASAAGPHGMGGGMARPAPVAAPVHRPAPVVHRAPVRPAATTGVQFHRPRPVADGRTPSRVHPHLPGYTRPTELPATFVPNAPWPQRPVFRRGHGLGYTGTQVIYATAAAQAFPPEPPLTETHGEPPIVHYEEPCVSPLVIHIGTVTETARDTVRVRHGWGSPCATPHFVRYVGPRVVSVGDAGPTTRVRSVRSHGHKGRIVAERPRTGGFKVVRAPSLGR